MRVIIAGSRKFPSLSINFPNDWEIDSKRIIMCKHLLEVIEKSRLNITEDVSGQAWGIDELGEAWAHKNKIPVKPFPAKWIIDGVKDKLAGFKRNAIMADYADALISIHSGSNDSVHMIECMKKLNKPYYERKIINGKISDSSSNLPI